MVKTDIMEDKFTIEEIRQYMLSQDSLGDVFYNLNPDKIREANSNKGVMEWWDELSDEEKDNKSEEYLGISMTDVDNDDIRVLYEFYGK